MIDEFSTFFVNGFPIAWSQIRNYWEDLRLKNKELAYKIGDPLYSEHACKEIAKILVHDLIKVGYFKLDNMEIESEDEKRKKGLNKNNSMSVLQDDTPDVDFWDTDEVIKKAFEDLERKHKEERIKQQERANFWKSQQNKQQTNQIPPPPPIEKSKEPIEWRKILGLPLGIKITEEVIKKYFRKEAMKRHPDKNGGKSELFNDLMEARDMAYMFIGLDPP